MRILGNLTFAGAGQIQNLRPENLSGDPSSPLVGQIWYNTTDGVYRGFDGTNIITFANGGNTADLLAELNAIETGAGLSDAGLYAAPNGTTYLGTATSLFNADVLLDTAIKAVSDAVVLSQSTADATQNELDVTQVAAGLNTDGTYTSPAGTTYLGAASTLKAADVLLDTAVKAAADAAAAAQATADLKVAKAGDSMSGNLAFGGTSTVTGLRAPENATDAARKIDIDNALSGLDFQPDVLATVVDATFDPTATPALGARYIVVDSAAINANFGTIAGLGNNDIVEYDGTAFVVVYDVSVKGDGALAWDKATKTWSRYDGTEWTTFGGLGDLNAGVGLVKSGNTLNVNLGAGIGQLPTDEVGIDVSAAGGLFTTIDGTSSSTGSAAQLAILLDGASLQTTGAGLAVKASGITETMLATSVAGAGLVGGAGTPMAVVAGTGISVTADDVALDLAYTDARYVNVDGDTMTGPLVLAADPLEALGAVTKQYADAINARLSASTFIYNGTTASTSHTVVHGLNNQYNGVTVYDAADKVIIPESISADSATQLTVTFASAVSCKVVVNGIKN